MYSTQEFRVVSVHVFHLLWEWISSSLLVSPQPDLQGRGEKGCEGKGGRDVRGGEGSGEM